MSIVEDARMLELTSTIKAVTVFRQGAQVERVISLPGGVEGAVRITGLPLVLLDDSIAIRVVGPEPRPVVTDYRIGLRVDGATEEGDLQQRLEVARHERDRWSLREQTLQDLRAQLETLETSTRPQTSSGPPVGTYELGGQIELLDFRHAQIASLDKALAEAAKAHKLAVEAVITLEHEQSSHAPEARPGELEKAVVVALQGSVAAGTTLLLRYRVPGARWAPAYSVSFSAALDTAVLTMRAMVAQRTGEDWSAVKLTLATADPSQWRNLPPWKSLKIGRSDEVSGLRWFPPPVGTEQLFADFDAANASMASETITLGPAFPPAPPPQPPYGAGADDEPPIYHQSYRQPVPFQDYEGGGGAATGSLQRKDSPAPGQDELAAEWATPVRAAAAPTAPALTAALAETAPRSRRGATPPPEPVESLELLERMETTVTLDQRYLRYGSLRLLDANSPLRGTLVALEAFEEYQQSWTINWTRTQISTATYWAGSAAQGVDHSSPPSGYTYPHSQAGFDFSYAAEAPIDLPSDGAFHNVPVFVTSMTPTVSYICVPRESQQVFRSARMTNPSGRALPDGPADISVAGEPLHTTPLRGVTPEGVLQLGLGVEQNVRVSRNASLKESTSGLMGGTTALLHTIDLEAVNHRAVEVLLEVQERLPQPAAEHKDELKVVLGSVKPQWEPFSPEYDPLLKSAYRWRLAIPAGQKVSAQASYSVEMGSKYELQGGNRREPRS